MSKTPTHIARFKFRISWSPRELAWMLDRLHRYYNDPWLGRRIPAIQPVEGLPKRTRWQRFWDGKELSYWEAIGTAKDGEQHTLEAKAREYVEEAIAEFKLKHKNSKDTPREFVIELAVETGE